MQGLDDRLSSMRADRVVAGVEASRSGGRLGWPAAALVIIGLSALLWFLIGAVVVSLI
jgi:hypothetical protein